MLACCGLRNGQLIDEAWREGGGKISLATGDRQAGGVRDTS